MLDVIISNNIGNRVKVEVERAVSKVIIGSKV